MIPDSRKGSARLEPTGEIGQMTVPWLFQGLRAGSKTATAVFEFVQEGTGAQARKKVYFKNGDVLFAASNLDEDRLGDYLLGQGKITKAQFDASTELLKKTNKRQGAILVELGFITPQELVAGLKAHVKQIILGLFAVRMGSYHVDEGPLPLADIIPLQMSTGNLILEGANGLAWEAMRKRLPAPDTVLRPSTDPSCLFQDAHLSADQKTVLSLIDGKKSIEEVCGLSGVGDFNALRALYVLLALRMAEQGQIKSAREMEFAREAVKEAVKTRAGAAAGDEAPATPEMIRQAYHDLAEQNHYQVMGIGELATSEQIKHAYLRLAKLYHPDRHFDLNAPDMKTILDALFARIHEAYEVLGNPTARAAYDLSKAADRTQSVRSAADAFEEKRPEDYQENYREKAARAAEWFKNGVKEYKAGNYWGAAEAFTWAVRLDPVKAPYFFYNGLSLARMPRRGHDAEENLQKAIELDPTKVDYFLELASLYAKSGVKAKALTVLNEGLTHHPEAAKILEAIKAAGGEERAQDDKKDGVLKKIFGGRKE